MIKLTSVWVEDLLGTTYGLEPLSQLIVCRGHMQIADGVNHALAVIESVTDTTPRGGFGILKRDEVSTSCPAACPSTHASSRFIFWHSGMSQTPGHSFSSKQVNDKIHGEHQNTLYRLACQEPRRSLKADPSEMEHSSSSLILPLRP